MKLKRFCAGLSALCMLCAVMPVLPVQKTAVLSANAEDTEYTYENFKYKKYEDCAEITGYVEEPSGELIIPEEIDGLPVSGITSNAFSGCEKITSLTLPDTVTIVSDYGAFRCDRGEIKVNTAWTNVINQRDIKSGAFWNCINLSAIHVSETHPTLSSVDGVLFNKDKTEIICYPAGKAEDTYKIPDSVMKIRAYPFSGSQELTSVVIPEDVTEIAKGAFWCCSGLSSAEIPNNITNIGSNTFLNCTALTSITIPDGVTSIGGGAFCSCSSLESIIIPDGVTSIGSKAFYNCSSLESITIPVSVTDIANQAFNNTPWMEAKREQAYKENQSIIINNILIWANNEFRFEGGGTTISDFIIPDGVTTIADSAFSINSIVSVTIPESVTNIAHNAFSGCTDLKSITIPSSVTSIGYGAFTNCLELTSVTIKNPNCMIEDDGGYTISNTWNNETYKPDFTGTIYGYENSTAQAYAEKYGYTFESIGSAPETTEPQTEEFKPGDADGSGKIDILDVITINKALLGKDKLTDEQLKAIDFNHNGKPDAEDSLLLMKYIAGLIDSLPTE